MEPGSRFKPVLDDPLFSTNKTDIERVVCLTGKLYYDLIKERQTRCQSESAASKVAFIRIEELCPFPFHDLAEILKTYSNAKEFIWLQEEPRNQGAYSFVQGRIDEVLRHIGKSDRVEYRGRSEDAVPAPGVARVYKSQQAKVMDSAFDRM